MYLARPMSEGLEYFSLDTDMEQDDKIAFIESKHGLAAFGLIVRLLMRIYKNGYYAAWTEREQYLFSKNISVDIMLTQTIVNDCINEGLFNKKLYEEFAILTSHGIQKRYIKACERRKRIVMIAEYFLINAAKDDVKMDNVTFTYINADNNQVNENITLTKTPQSKVKESKVNKSKPSIRAREDGIPVDNVDNFFDGLVGDDLYPSGNGGEETPSPAQESSSVESSVDFMEFWNAYPKRSGMQKAIEAWDFFGAKGMPLHYLVRAAQKYALATKANDMQFIKMPHNFLLEGIYQDYLPHNLPECPRCRGHGHYELADGVKVCDCRKYVFGERMISLNSA